MTGTEHFITCRPPATLQMKCTNSMILFVWNRIGFIQTNRQNQSRGERDQNSDCLRRQGWEWRQVVWWKWRVCDRILPFPKFYNLTEREESYRRWKQCQKSSKKPRRLWLHKSQDEKLLWKGVAHKLQTCFVSSGLNVLHAPWDLTIRRSLQTL